MKELCASICAYHLTSMPACPVQENQVQSCSGGGHVLTLFINFAEDETSGS